MKFTIRLQLLGDVPVAVELTDDEIMDLADKLYELSGNLQVAIATLNSADDNAPKGGGVEQPAAAVKGQADDEFVVSAVENKDGRIRVKGGKYAKYGIPVYLDSLEAPEDLKQYIASLPEGEFRVFPEWLARLHPSRRKVMSLTTFHKRV